MATGGYVHGAAAVAGTTAVIAGCDGVLRRLDLDTGQELSSVDLGTYAAASSAVAGGRAYLGTFGDEVVAVDLEDARVVWRYRPAGSSFPFYASAAVAGGRVIAGGRDSQVHAIDAGAGEALWVFAAGGRVDASPVIAGDRVYAASMRGRLHGLDLATGAEMWTFEGASAFAASPAVASGRLVIGDTDGVLYCFADSSVETE